MDRRKVVGGDGAHLVAIGPPVDDGSQHGLHGRDLAEEVAGGVDEVRANGTPAAPAPGGVAPPVPGACAVASCRAGVTRLGVTQCADVRRPRGKDGGEKAQLVIDERELTGVPARRGHEFLRLAGMQRRRLLAEHVFARVERRRGHGQMLRGRRDDGDQVDVAGE